VEALEDRIVPSFATPATFPFGFSQTGTVAGDFNGDGRVDLATADVGTNNVDVVLGRGDGTFGAPSSYVAYNQPAALVAGDFNGDGKLDLAAANFAGNKVSVLLGNGDGTFRKAVNYNVDGFPQGLAVGDVNGDGKLDLIVLDNLGKEITVLLGGGDGTFRKAVHTPLDVSAGALAVGDFNHDGKLDVAVSAGYPGEVEVLFGTGGGHFGKPLVINTGGAGAVAAADLNGDGVPDLVVSRGYRSYQLAVLLSNGDGTFGTPTIYTTPSDPRVIAVADINGDGRPDLLAADPGGTLSVFTNAGGGTFGAGAGYVIPQGVAALVPADDNGDGRIDLNVAGGGLTVLLNQGGTFLDGAAVPLTPVTPPFPNQPVAVAAGDLDGDGRPDLVATTDTSDVAVFLDDGAGGFRPAAYYPTGADGGFSKPVLADLNGDGKLDLVVTDVYGGGVRVLLGNGDGTFGPPARFATGGGYPADLAVADLNGDGKPDLVVADNDYFGSVDVLLGNGDGTFQAPVVYATGIHTGHLVVGDFNCDGKPDVAAANSGDGTVNLFLGNGDGTLGAPSTLYLGGAPAGLAAADFNGDGRLDLAVVNPGKSEADVLLGNGDGTFSDPARLDSGYLPRTVYAGDFNGDGRVDLLVGLDGEDQLNLLLNDGHGTFGTPVRYLTGNHSGSFAVGDFNGDGLLDAAVADSATTSLTVIYGLPQRLDSAAASAPPQTAPGLPAPVTVTITTPTGAIDATYTGTVHFTSSDPAAVLPPDYTFTAADQGRHTFDVTLRGAGPQTVTATDVAVPTITAGVTVTVNPQYAAHFTLTPLSNAAVGYKVTFRLDAADASGNPAAGYTGTVHFTSSDPAAVLPPDYTFTAADGGSHLFTVVFGSPGAQSLTATDTLLPALTAGAPLTVRPMFENPVGYGLAGGPAAVATADFNGDGIPDLVAISGGAQISLLLGRGDGTFKPARTFSVPGSSPGLDNLAVGDFNGDGLPDVALVDETDHQVDVLLNNGRGGFHPAQTYLVGSGVNAGTNGIAVGDFNNDGHPDLAVSNVYDATIDILLNDGTGHFRPGQTLAEGAADDLVAADFTGGGNVDLITSGLHLLAGDGTGGFTDEGPIKPGGGFAALAVADMNRDHRPDLVAADLSTGTLTVFLNAGQGRFVAHSLAGVGGGPLVVGDFNGDGHEDVAVRTGDPVTFAPRVSVFLGDGRGGLSPQPLNFAVGSGAAVLGAPLYAVGDFNGDKTPDLAVVDVDARKVDVLLNSDAITTHFSVVGPGPVPAGGTAALIVTALTQFGTVDTAYAGSVHFTSSDPSAVLPPDYLFLAGDHGRRTFYVTLYRAGRQTVSVEDASLSLVAGFKFLWVQPGPVRQLRILAPARQRLGVPFTFSVTAFDFYGNVVTGFRDTVHFTSTDPAASLPADYVFAAADGGTHAFQMTWGSIGRRTLRVTDLQHPTVAGAEVFLVL
jgi:hypothetical protein